MVVKGTDAPKKDASKKEKDTFDFKKVEGVLRVFLT